MARTKRIESDRPIGKFRPSATPEGREKQLISLAMERAEEQLRDGTASSQVITHFLKLGTRQAELELEKMRLENELVKAKTESIRYAEHIEEVYTNAIKAMQSYSGHGDSDDY